MFSHLKTFKHRFCTIILVLSVPSQDRIFFILGKECRSISNRGRRTRVLKVPSVWSAFWKIIPYFHFLTYRSHSVCHCILYFLSVIMLDDFCILSTSRPVSCNRTSCYTTASPKQLLLGCCSNVANHKQGHQVISGIPCFNKQAKSAVSDVPDLISKPI